MAQLNRRSSAPAARPGRRHPRPLAVRGAGFSFIEIIVALAIMTMIAAVVTPTVFSNLDRARLERALGSLEGLTTAIATFEDDVRETPGALTQLAAQITASQKNVCGLNYAEHTGKGGTQTWNGPYIGRSIPQTGLPVGVGIARDAIEINPAGGSRIVIPGVTEEDALALNEQLDADGNRSAGAIQWSTPDAGGMVDLYYVFPQRRC